MLFVPIAMYSEEVGKVFARGVLKFGFGKDVPPRNLKVDLYKYQFFQENGDPFIYQLAQFWAKF